MQQSLQVNVKKYFNDLNIDEQKLQWVGIVPMYDVRFAKALWDIGIFDLCLEVKCFRLSLAHC